MVLKPHRRSVSLTGVYMIKVVVVLFAIFLFRERGTGRNIVLCYKPGSYQVADGRWREKVGRKGLDGGRDRTAGFLNSIKKGFYSNEEFLILIQKQCRLH